MRTVAPERPGVISVAVAGLGSMLPWCGLFLGVQGVLLLPWPSDAYLAPFWWVWWAADEAGFILPFVLFAGGLKVAQVLGYSRRLLPTAIAFGLTVGGVSYYLTAWGAPELESRYWDTLGEEIVAQRTFGAATPPNILENLRMVEDNPPAEYSLGVSNPSQAPPNVLRWRLHLPIAMAVFGLINTMMGVLAAQLTENFGRGPRRNVLLALGVLGGVAYFGAVMIAGPVEPFLRDGTMRSGVVAAWIPLVVPFLLASVLFGIARKRYV